MRSIPSLLFALLLLSCNSKSPEQLHQEANKLEKQGKFEEAIKLLDQGLEEDPENINMLLDRGVDKSEIGDYEGAIEDYTRVINIDPNNTLAFTNRANNFNNLEEYTKAIEDYDLAIQTKGGEQISIEWTDNEFTDNYQYDVAMNEIIFDRGTVYYNMDSAKLALNDFTRSVNQGYFPNVSYYWKGLCQLKLGDTLSACQDLHKSYDLDGDSTSLNLINQHCE